MARVVRAGLGVHRLPFTAGRIAKTRAAITVSDNVNATARQSTCADLSSGLRTGSSATRRRAIPPDSTRPKAAPHAASASPPEETDESGEGGSHPGPRESQLPDLAAANAPTEAAPYSRTQSTVIRRHLPAAAKQGALGPYRPVHDRSRFRPIEEERRARADTTRRRPPAPECRAPDSRNGKLGKARPHPGRLAIEAQDPPHYARIRSHSRAPEGAAEKDYGRSARLTLFCQKRPAQRCLYPQQRKEKEGGRNARSEDTHRLFGSRERA